MFDATSTSDCQAIIKAFERGANYSTTEESVYAMLTPQLTNARIHSQAFLKTASAVDAGLIDDSGATVDNPNIGQTTQSLTSGTSVNVNKNEDDVVTANIRSVGANLPQSSNVIDTEIGGASLGNLMPGKRGKALKAWLKECIPCIQRIELMDDFWVKWWENIKAAGLYYQKFFEEQLRRLSSLLDAFFNWDKYSFNVCELLKFFTEFVCLPDFRRIIAALMALLMRMAMELNSLFDLILQLVAPLLLPFLMAIMVPLEQMLMLILEPLECIINALIAQLGKLDYSAAFNTQIPEIKIGPVGGKVTLKTNTVFTEPIQKAINVAPEWGWNPNPGGWKLNDHTSQAEDLAAAKANLEVVRAQAGNVDLKEASAREEYAKKLAAARADVAEKQKLVDTTAIQRQQERLAKTRQQIRDAFMLMIKYIRMAKEKATEYVMMVIDEIKKLFEAFLGQESGAMIKLWDKLQVIQLITAIMAILKFLKQKKNCEDDDTKRSALLSMVSPLTNKTTKVWVDDSGQTHIEENPEVLSNAIINAVSAAGYNPKQSALVIDSDTPTNPARQRLSSLIELTGDPILDASIARGIEAITSPVKATFKCPLQTSVADAEQVNQWIAELNSR